jgi:uncharacterized protein YjbI with pentapeptide repeats
LKQLAMTSPNENSVGLRTSASPLEIIQKYQVGQREFDNIELPNDVSLRGTILSGASFRNSWLSGVDFRDADLRMVCFDGSNVKVSDFRGADFRGASFRGAAVCGARFGDAKLDEVSAEGASWYGITIRSIDEIANLGPN